MTAVKCVVFSVVVTFLLTPVRGGEEISCVFTESCILPCEFQAGTDVVIHWIHVTTGNAPVHSYYHSRDQLSHQDKSFRKRTSLFKDQIAKGNASLQLKGVEFNDGGRYKCYTSTISGNKESFININVHVPVRKVDLKQAENKISCRSDGIFPKPELSWSTSPQSNMSIQSPVTSSQSEPLLYSISSSLTLSDDAGDLTYICTVSTRRSSRKTSLKTLPPISGSSTEMKIACAASNTPLTGLVWIFNHSQLILNRTEADVSYTVSEEWRRQVKDVSDSGSLTLQDLSSKHEGTYTCELSNAEETYIRSTDLKINEGNPLNVAVVIGGVTGGILLVVAALAGGQRLLRTTKNKKKAKNGDNREEQNEERTELQPQL